MREQSDNTIKIGICGNEQGMVSWIQQICNLYLEQKNKNYQLKHYKTGREVVEEKKLEKTIDILFLDITLPDMSGFQLGEWMNGKGISIKLIYFGGTGQEVNKAFKVKAFRYLCQNYTKWEVREVLIEAIDEIEKEKIFVVEENQFIYYLKKWEIMYIESLGDGTAIHCSSGVICSRYTLKYWREQLDESFFSCHREYIVQLEWILKYEKNKFILKNGEKIEISVRNQKNAKQIFLQYLQSQHNSIFCRKSKLL